LVNVDGTDGVVHPHGLSFDDAALFIDEPIFSVCVELTKFSTPQPVRNAPNRLDTDPGLWKIDIYLFDATYRLIIRATHAFFNDIYNHLFGHDGWWN
jgi:hypothetical protein